MAVYGKMSQNRKLYWRGVYVLFVWMLIVLRLQVITGMKEDKVCYANETPVCINQHLNCLRPHEIAVVSAGYSYTTNCTCENRYCVTCRSNGHKVNLAATASCRDEYYDDDYRNLISECSKRNSCFFAVPIQRYYNECSSLTSFSHIRYRCVNKKNEVNMCDGQMKMRSHVSLLYNKSMLKGNENCFCKITGSNSDPTAKYNITALEIKLGDTCAVYRQKPSLILTSSSDEYRDITDQIRPNTLLFNPSVSSTTIVKLSIPLNCTPERIWLLVEGVETTQFNISCETRIHHDQKRDSMMSSMVYAVIGGILGTFFLLGLMIIAVFCFRKRRKTSTSNTKHYETKVTMKREAEHDYSQIEDLPSHQNVQQCSELQTSTDERQLHSGTDEEERYVDMVSDPQNLPGGTEHDGVSTGKIHMGDTSEGDECYNVLNTTTSEHTKFDSNYDTMVSASKAGQAVSDENYYSYDHLGSATVLERTDNDYDLIFQSNQD